jgi:hypothetical protein
MKSSKVFGVVLAVCFVLSVLLIQPSITNASPTASVTVKEKTLTFLSDVIGIDVSKYNLTYEGYVESYPTEFGGKVKREQGTFTLESNTSRIPVSAIFDNDSVFWFHVSSIGTPVLFVTQPSDDARVESRNVLQRYQEFCQKYGVNASHITTELNLLDILPASPPANESSSTNFNKISDFTPATTISGNMQLTTSQTNIIASYTTEGVSVPNKSLGITFGGNAFVFVDTWNLYKIGSLSVISEEEATSIAFEAAKQYAATLQIGTSSGSIPVNPEWSTRTDVGVNMVPGQSHNSSITGLPQTINMGTTRREQLLLYPLWQAIFYFAQPVGNIVGVQVSVWGDTKEIAYCTSYGYLGGSCAIATPTPSASPSSDKPTLSPTSQSLLLAIVASALTIALAATVLATKKPK